MMSNGFPRALMLAALLAACGSDGADSDEAVSEPNESRQSGSEAPGSQEEGEAAPTASADSHPPPAPHSLPAFFASAADLSNHDGLDLLADSLRAIAASPPESERKRWILQNDCWGLVARLDRRGVSSDDRRRLRDAAMDVIRAVTPPSLPQLANAELPAVVRDALPQMREAGSEMPVLNHENAFGLRRIFRFVRSANGRERALFSQLVGFDQEGRLGLLPLVGEIEYLRFASGENPVMLEARVWDLDRSTGELRETRHVTHVPDQGADGFFIQEPTPVSLDELPCVRCHDDDSMMTLPNSALAVDERWAAILDQARPPEL